MKLLLNMGCILITLAIFALPVQSGAQVRVTAHATAEVVEAIQAAPHTQNDLMISPGADALNLGEIVLNGGRSTTCTVMVTSGQLAGDNGNVATFTTNPVLNNTPLTLDPEGQRTIRLNATTGGDIFSNPDKTYTGEYQVVFAYN